jgi:hypothetical protein
MRDAILLSALRREMAAATTRVRAAIEREGYRPAGGTWSFMDFFPTVHEQSDDKAEEDRGGIVVLLGRIEEDRRNAMARYDERAAHLHEAAAYYDQVKTRLRAAERDADGQEGRQ